MTPQQQRLKDDCVQACIASLLDLPLHAVPRIKPGSAEPVFWRTWRHWLDRRGYRLRFWCGSLPNVPFLAITVTSRVGYYHAVVMDAVGDLLWDPAPVPPNFAAKKVLFGITLEPS